jgi:hypothetical protein
MKVIFLANQNPKVTSHMRIGANLCWLTKHKSEPTSNTAQIVTFPNTNIHHDMDRLSPGYAQRLGQQSQHKKSQHDNDLWNHATGLDPGEACYTQER